MLDFTKLLQEGASFFLAFLPAYLCEGLQLTTCRSLLGQAGSGPTDEQPPLPVDGDAAAEPLAEEENAAAADDDDQPIFSTITGTYRHPKRYGATTTTSSSNTRASTPFAPVPHVLRAQSLTGPFPFRPVAQTRRRSRSARPTTSSRTRTCPTRPSCGRAGRGSASTRASGSTRSACSRRAAAGARGTTRRRRSAGTIDAPVCPSTARTQHARLQVHLPLQADEVSCCCSKSYQREVLTHPPYLNFSRAAPLAPPARAQQAAVRSAQLLLPPTSTLPHSHSRGTTSRDRTRPRPPSLPARPPNGRPVRGPLRRLWVLGAATPFEVADSHAGPDHFLNLPPRRRNPPPPARLSSGSPAPPLAASPSPARRRCRSPRRPPCSRACRRSTPA